MFRHAEHKSLHLDLVRALRGGKGIPIKRICREETSARTGSKRKRGTGVYHLPGVKKPFSRALT